MACPEINLLEELDSVSSIHQLNRDDIDALMLACAQKASQLFEIERVNAWLLNKNKDAIISIGEYDTRTKKFNKNTVIPSKDCPNYFKSIIKNKIILVENVYTNSVTSELTDNYLRPNNIISLMDIPLRMNGELIGVMCLEKTGDAERVFSKDEQTFALGLGFLISSSLEARKRRSIQHDLEKLLEEKELLIKEINHRVKNNFSILISLLRLSKNKKGKKKTEEFINDFEQRINAMLKIHEMLNASESYSEVNISFYLYKIVSEFKETFTQLAITSEIEDSDTMMDSKKALHLGLIITEILLNAAKHETANGNHHLEIIMTTHHNKNKLTIHLPGKAFNFNEKLKDETLGLSLIKDLAESIDATTHFPKENNGLYLFEF
jgi:two-component sensor histidine kinase